MIRNIYDHNDLTVCDYGSVICLSPLLWAYLSDYPSDKTIFYNDLPADYDGYRFINTTHSETQRLGSEAIRMFTNIGIIPPAVTVMDIETTGLEPQKDKVERIGFYYVEPENDWNNSEEYYVLLEGEEEDILPVAVYLLKETTGLLVGHNIAEFDIPFLKTRWQRYCNLSEEEDHMPFPLTQHKSKQFRVGMETKSVSVWKNYTTQVIDTMPLSQRFDNMTGSRVGGYGLKQLCYEWGLTEKKRTDKYMYAEDQTAYLLDDLSDTYKLFRHVTEWFYELFSFGAITWSNVYDGMGSLVNNILMTWLYPLQPIPKRKNTADAYEGGYVELLQTGYYKNVSHIDVVSMYPNIMRRYIKPYWDTKGYFSAVVGTLLDLRLEYKKQGVEGKQKALKILINSMYGFLASGLNYSDADSAKAVTEKGRFIIGRMKNEITENGGTVIEIDTDGIYFQHSTPPLIKEKVENAIGLETELTQYDAGLFVKKKNYALWKNNAIILKGNSLRSRRDNVIYSQIVMEIVNAFTKPNPVEEIRKLWEKAQNEFYVYDLKTLPKAWYSDRTIPQAPPKTINERLERLEKLYNVFMRFEDLPEIKEALEGERKPVWRKRIATENQMALFDGGVSDG